MNGLFGLLRRLSKSRILRWGICVATGGGACLLLAGCGSLSGATGEGSGEPYELSFRLRAGPPREASPRTPLICKPDGTCSVATPTAVTKGS